MFTYWDNDQLKTVTDQHGVTQYFYDIRDRLSYKLDPDGTRLDYQYDNVGNRTQVKVTRNTAETLTDYSYDGYHRLQTVTDANGVTSYTYDAVGNLDTVSYPNGLVADYDYNSINQLTTITTRDSTNGNAVVSSYSYGLKPSGRRESITEHTGRVTTYSYDDLYRLKTEVISDAVNGDYSASYTYDFVGNRTYETVDGVQTQYSYDNNDRLQSQGGTTYTYDDNGNTLTENGSGVITTYTYDAKNKLGSVDKAGVITNYSYNHNGIRTSKTESGITTDFIVDENRDYAQVLEEVVSGNSVVKYSYGHDLLNQDRGGVVGYYHYDGLGSVRSLTDTAGATTDVYNYEAFGEVLNQTGTTENGYLFAGEQFDNTLNQYYLRARYYDQNIGRFTQLDTFQGLENDPASLHKYLYTPNDPVNYTDPSGNFFGGTFAGGIALTLNTLSVASSAYDVFQLATGQEEFSFKQAGLSILLSRLPGSSGFVKQIVSKYKAKTGKNLTIPCVKNSFVAGTLIHTQQGLVPIEDVKIGDYVLSFNEMTGEKEYQEVIHLIQHQNDYQLVEVESSSGESFIATPDHPFYVDGDWKNADDLSLSDKLFLAEGYSSVAGLSSLDLTTKVYNLSVANTHNYYIGKAGTLVHNTNCVPRVNNMNEFFDLPFGSLLKGISSRTGRTYQSVPIFQATKKSGHFKKGDYYYLDKQHGDHIEVFDKNGNFKTVLNLDGTKNASKIAAAAGRSIKDIIK